MIPENTDTPLMADCPSASCWADLTTAQRNNLIGNLIGADPIRRPYMARDGKYLWYCPITAEEADERSKWLAEQQATEESWKQFRKDFDDRITAEDRGKITIEIEEHHIRYSDTPGGGWMVIEAVRKAGYAVQIASTGKGWKAMTIVGHDALCVRSESMEDAACQLALTILPNSGIK
jgi:hypothetical protein